MLELKNLTVKIENKTILHNLNYKFRKDKIYALMGPNGSGKSTLAHTILGNPEYQLNRSSSLWWQKENITKLNTDQRVQKGIFMTFQQPNALSGVNVFQLLHISLLKIEKGKDIDQRIKEYATQLQIPNELLFRSLNEGFSGGEKKKLEVLQAAVLNPQFLIFDEIDSGVDIDALKTMALFIKKMKKEKTFLIITHVNRILKFLKPDHVLIMQQGQFSKEGGNSLVKEIEEKGYH